MHRKTYAVGFGIVALSVLMVVITGFASRLGVHMRYLQLFSLFEMFSHPVPAMLRGLLPRLLHAALFWTFAALIARRLWLLFVKRAPFPPSSFTRGLYVLTLISVVSVVLLVLGLLLSIAISAGSGVPAGLLAIPAVVLLSPVIAWVEVRSLSIRKTEA